MVENLVPFPDFYKMAAILDHCHEVAVLKDRERILKATPGVGAEEFALLREKLDGELADLYIYLEHWFADRSGVVESRREKMRAFRAADKA